MAVLRSIEDAVDFTRKKAEEAKARLSEASERSNQPDQPQSPDAPLPHNVVRLPSWSDVERCVPNGFLRSALFGAVAKGRRRYMQMEEVAALNGIQLRYTGQRLDQGDLDVWESVLHMTRSQEMGEKSKFTAYALFKLMGKTDTGKNRETLHARLIRLKANAVEIQQGRYSYAGSLIDDVYRDKVTQEYVIVLNPKLRPLFAGDQFTQIDWKVRHDLDGHQLAQWLHGFYSSHAKPYPMKVETLFKLCGSESVRMDHFRQQIRKALDALQDASKTNAQPFNYEIRGDLVHVRKPAKGAQQWEDVEPKKPRS